ncbi:HNH endonuclease [Sorangium sp. So ce341]|uniref:HNH endonuclease n=1 Tax=Sorangium sp. So ce341 TaxID=3133302 RepID=UPI003F60E684
MSTYLSELLRSRIEEADRRRCQTCLTSEANSGIPLTCDHITPVSKRGPTWFENVCLACRPCNEFKAGATESVDPLTGEVVPLFNPRLHRWSDHFTWSVDGTRVEGVTPSGRATVTALRMNRPTIVAARRRWAEVGWHPSTMRDSFHREPSASPKRYASPFRSIT